MKLPRITSSNVFSVLLVLCVLCCVVFYEKSVFWLSVSEWAVEGAKKRTIWTTTAADRLSSSLFPHAHTSNTHVNMERTYIMIKPDGVQRGLIHKVIERFEQRGFYLKAMKMQMVTKEHAEKHYADLSSKPFFAGLVTYMCSGPVVCMVWEGKDVVKTGRKIIGATNPLASEPGSLRGDFCIEVGRNVIHGSDAVESAQHEIGLWFPEGVCEYEHALQKWIYE